MTAPPRRVVRETLQRHPLVVAALAAVGVLSVAVAAVAQLPSLAGSVGTRAGAREAAAAAAGAAGPGPRALFVVAGGAPRTGSTVVYNALRVLLRTRDPNTVASSEWMLAKLVPENRSETEFDRVGLLRSMGTTVLVKLHTAKQYREFVGPGHTGRFAGEVDLLVSGYRDLREETASALKMFEPDRAEWGREGRWREMCRALVRRRESLIKEAGAVVPVVDVRYEDWRGAGRAGLEALVRRLAAALPWAYEEADIQSTVREVGRLRVPTGGEPGKRVEWHVANLMSPKHISTERLAEEVVRMGRRAVETEPTCGAWLAEKGYV